MIRVSRQILRCVLSVLYTLSAYGQVPLDESNTCNLTSIPSNALRVIVPQTPPMFHFPDPRTVSQDYSGCLNTWLEGNIRMIEAKFVNGRIKWYRMGSGEIYCEYENDRVIRQDVKDEIKKKMEASLPKPQYDYQFCPPGVELVPTKWK